MTTGWADLRFDSALEDTDNHVARLQSIPSDSFASSRRTEAARNSRRSSSDQESDQSILRSGASEARRSINRDNSMAASGGSLRNAPSRDASCEFRRISIIHTQYTVSESTSKSENARGEPGWESASNSGPAY